VARIEEVARTAGPDMAATTLLNLHDMGISAACEPSNYARA
jgi:hypothetical protein